jgi:DnaK suppressor protein
VPARPDPDAVGRALQQQRLDAESRISTAAAQLAELHAAVQDSNVDDEHDPEGATIAFERAQLEAALQRARQQLVAVDHSLALVRDDRYGACETCGRPIGADRLAALPTTRRCVECARRTAR